MKERHTFIARAASEMAKALFLLISLTATAILIENAPANDQMGAVSCVELSAFHTQGCGFPLLSNWPYFFFGTLNPLQALQWSEYTATNPVSCKLRPRTNRCVLHAYARALFGPTLPCCAVMLVYRLISKGTPTPTSPSENRNME